MAALVCKVDSRTLIKGETAVRREHPRYGVIESIPFNKPWCEYLDDTSP